MQVLLDRNAQDSTGFLDILNMELFQDGSVHAADLCEDRLQKQKKTIICGHTSIIVVGKEVCCGGYYNDKQEFYKKGEDMITSVELSLVLLVLYLPQET